jgi:D-alanyl-lipoteichoic acid acyltransferase DltB (MBOAT superfamily)
MLFNSLDFAIYLPVVFGIYWFVVNRNLKLQNSFILLASYVFYGWWDWRFLTLILFSTIVDYLVGIQLGKEKKPLKRKLLLWTSLTSNLGLLGFFKYYNFFVDSFVDAFSLFGYSIASNSLNIILPVGISFYTFQTLSYTIDIYKKKLEPTPSFISFAAFVSFFPQLVAGPIERASHLLPQFFNKRVFNYNQATDGLRQILWGLFKKIVIADNCAVFANEIFNNSTEYSGVNLLLGALFFTFQIYGDFSGYSDIAIGVSRLFGFDLMQNFAFPYFSRDIAEFWRRWHISLSTWFRDYVYIPLGGSRVDTIKKLRNIFIIFIVSGFWHGANWTFIAWGFLNACYFLPLLLAGKNRANTDIVAQGRLIPNLRELGSITSTFLLTLLAWVFFRANNLSHAFSYINGIFSDFQTYIDISNYADYSWLFLLITVFMGVEWLGREGKYALESILARHITPIRYAFYYVLVFFILWFSGKEQTFIYFQF